MDWKIIEIDPSTRVLVVELIILFEEVRFESSNRAPKRGGDRWLVGARARARERHAPTIHSVARGWQKRPFTASPLSPRVPR